MLNKERKKIRIKERRREERREGRREEGEKKFKPYTGTRIEYYPEININII